MRVKIFIIALLSSSVLIGQSKKELIEMGDGAMMTGNYTSAAHYYSLVINPSSGSADGNKYPYAVGAYQKPAKKDDNGNLLPPDSPNKREKLVIHKMSDAYRMARDYESAEQWYAQAVQHPHEQFPNARYFYGISLMKNEKFEEAQKQFEMAIEEYGDTEELSTYKDRAQDKLIYCEFAMNPENKSNEIKIDLMDTLINKGSASYGMQFTPNGKLMFASARKDSASEDIEASNNYYELDLYKITKEQDGSFSNLKKISEQLSTDFNEGSAVYTKDGRNIYYSRMDPVNRNETKIYVIRKFNNRWLDPFPLDSNVNMDGFRSMDPYLSPEGKVLYFSSNRPGGEGGMDIWQVNINEYGETSKPVNLGNKVNTPFNDISPFYHEDSEIFYFSSEGHIGFGGFDIFRSKWNPDAEWWDKAENVGAPINSSRDDSHYILNEDQTLGYVTSDRLKCTACETDSLQDAKGNCNRIYEITQPDLYFTISGFVFDVETDDPIPNANVKLVDYTYQMEEINIKTDEEGFYRIDLIPNIEFFMKATKKDYFADAATNATLGLTKTTHLTQDFFLEKIPQGEIEIEGIEYDFDSANLRESSKEKLDVLVDFLILNSNIKVEIRSHTDERGSDSYNLTLSQGRAKSVVDYLIENGIDQERLLSKGYGETEPAVIETEDGEEVELTPEFIYSLDSEEKQEEYHQRNRRTAFKVLSQDVE